MFLFSTLYFMLVCEMLKYFADFRECIYLVEFTSIFRP